MVSWIWCTKRGASTVRPPRRETMCSAEENRPRRTSHQGDSGANGRPMSRRVGKIHWMALGRERLEPTAHVHSQRDPIRVLVRPCSATFNHAIRQELAD